MHACNQENMQENGRKAVNTKFGPAGPLLNTEQIKRQNRNRAAMHALVKGKKDKKHKKDKAGSIKWTPGQSLLGVKKERDEITVGVWRTNASLRGRTKRTSHSHKVAAYRNRVRPPCPGNQSRALTKNKSIALGTT